MFVEGIAAPQSRRATTTMIISSGLQLPIAFSRSYLIIDQNWTLIQPDSHWVAHVIVALPLPELPGKGRSQSGCPGGFCRAGVSFFIQAYTVIISLRSSGEHEPVPQHSSKGFQSGLRSQIDNWMIHAYQSGSRPSPFVRQIRGISSYLASRQPFNFRPR